jgi:hypothetical protein
MGVPHRVLQKLSARTSRRPGESGRHRRQNRDTLFRIHGTVEPWTIGKSVSSGCIRVINQDVMDLYQHTDEIPGIAFGLEATTLY